MAGTKENFQASQVLAVFAAGLWIASLMQPGLIAETGGAVPNRVPGYSLLLFGALGLIEGIVAWYANPLFLFATVSLLRTSSRLPWVAAILASLLTLDTFRLQRLPGGGGGDVYGYGLGTMLWFTAHGVLLVAVAWRHVELRDGARSAAAWRAPAVMASLALLVIGLGSYGVHAYRAAGSLSATESTALRGGSVKRGEVCREVVTVPVTRLELKGPLEIEGSAHPLDSPLQLLAWGIPVVRKNGVDFALSSPGDLGSVYAKAAEGRASALLTLSQGYVPQSHNRLETIEAALTSADGATTAFRQLWSRDIRKGSNYCPDFVHNEPSSPPGSLLLAALEIPGGLKPARSVQPQNALSVPPFSRQTLPAAKILARNAGSAVPPSQENPGCGARAGFIPQDHSATTLGMGGAQIFRVDDRRYFLLNNQPLSVVCAGDSAYLHYLWLNEDRKSFLLYIQRRDLADFRPVWTTVRNLDYERGEPFKGRPDVRVRSVGEKDGLVSLELADIDQALAVGVAFTPE